LALYDLEFLGIPSRSPGSDIDAECLSVRKELSREIVDVVYAFLNGLKRDGRYLDKTSPLLANWTYQAATTYARLYVLTEEAQYLQYWSVLRESFVIVATRWRGAGNGSPSSLKTITMLMELAAVYLQMLETRNSIEMS
jgi:hypothetical protein